MSQINDPIDLISNILSYMEDNLNTYIDEVNTEKNAIYGCNSEMEQVKVYGQREELTGRQQELIKFQIVRDDISINDKNNTNYLASQNVSVGCFVNFYDDGTENSFSMGQRYEESVYRAIRGMSFQETADIRIVGRMTAPFTVEKQGKKTPQGIITAGVIINLVIGG